jgi:hypothetical protein
MEKHQPRNGAARSRNHRAGITRKLDQLQVELAEVRQSLDQLRELPAITPPAKCRREIEPRAS